METESRSQLAGELGGGPAYRFSAEGRKTRLFINIINDLTQCNYARTWFSHLISSFLNCFRAADGSRQSSGLRVRIRGYRRPFRSQTDID